MTEHGFFHPSRGYWQTISTPSPATLAGYPAGTTEVPLKPGADFDWDGEAWQPVPPPPPSTDDVDADRDRRIDGGFTLNGVRFQSRPSDRENIAGASTAALAAIMSGAEPGDYRWHGGDSDFAWIAEDNTLHPLDAQTMFALGQAAMAHKQAHIFAARALKDLDPIPADFADDQYWPDTDKDL